MTKEDWICWFKVMHGKPTAWTIALRSHSRVSDLGDYGLMLLAQSIAKHGPTGLDLYGIPFRGWDQRD